MSLTQELCKNTIELFHDDQLPLPASRAAMRSLLNVMSTTVGASQSPAVQIAIEVGRQLGGAGEVRIPGRIEQLAPYHAAIAIGLAAHLDDFDDTHLDTVIHPGAATLAAGIAASNEASTTGARFVRAFALGCEIQLRVGLAMSPSHYDLGWHITGTCGVIGAAVTAALLIDDQADADRLVQSIGLAVGQTLGVRDAFGTMTKAFHPGKAAANGRLAAVLASAGVPGPQGALDADGHFFATLAETFDATTMLAGFGDRWHLVDNTFKPYPCGIVCHPAIDAATALSKRGLVPETIKDVRVLCHPLVVELTNIADPADGLQARFSTIHGVAVGLIEGRAGLAEYDDARVRAADVAALRQLVTLVVDESQDRDSATIEVTLDDGTTLREQVVHARGSRARPLTDEELRDKSTSLLTPFLGDRTQELIDAVDQLEDSPSLRRMLSAATPLAAMAVSE